MKNFLEIIENIKKIKGLRQDSEVAVALGMKPNAFYNHKTRGTMPLDFIVLFCDRENVSFDELVLGRNPIKINPENDLDEIKKRLAALEKKNKK